MRAPIATREQKIEWLRPRLKIIPEAQRNEDVIRLLAVRMRREGLYSKETYTRDIMCFIERAIKVERL